ncbi:hypothetical protein CGRA01v4_04529 [Colletotrichum graminicola]|nr:hypothetical protein CGRA01v4_04529 [Colletotrichum graminicola]
MTSWNFHAVCHVIHSSLVDRGSDSTPFATLPPLWTSFGRHAGLTTRALVSSSAPALLDHNFTSERCERIPSYLVHGRSVEPFSRQLTLKGRSVDSSWPCTRTAAAFSTRVPISRRERDSQLPAKTRNKRRPRRSFSHIKHAFSDVLETPINIFGESEVAHCPMLFLSTR